MAETWLAWALVCTVAWGLGTLASKPATDRYGPKLLFLGSAATEGAVFGVLGLLLPTSPDPVAGATAVVAFVAGVAGILGYLFFFEGIRWGSVGFVGTVSAAYPAMTVGLALVLLPEPISAWQGLGVLLMLLCIGILVYAADGARRPARPAVVLSLLGFVSWGVWGFLVNATVDVIGEANLFRFYALANLSVGAAYALARKSPRAQPGGGSRRTAGYAIGTIGAGAIGVFAVTIAYTTGQASLVTPISGSYPIVATLGAALLLREPLGLRAAVAMLCFAAGIFLIAGA